LEGNVDFEFAWLLLHAMTQSTNLRNFEPWNFQKIEWKATKLPFVKEIWPNCYFSQSGKKSLVTG
jgi:hypothetical protein